MSGRGAYYKAKYGGGRGGGRGGGGRGGGRGDDDRFMPQKRNLDDSNGSVSSRAHIGTLKEFQCILQQIDNKQYPCYKDLLGSWDFDGSFVLHVDYVQGDAFAAPSDFRVEIPHSVTGLPVDLWNSSKVREVATADFFARSFGKAVARAGGDVRRSGGWHDAKGGEMTVDTPGQAVLERTAVLLHSTHLEARFTVALPAQGRRIIGSMANQIFVAMLPNYVSSAFLYSAIDKTALKRHICCVEDTAFLRNALSSLNLVAFVGNGSVLPRMSGASDEQMKGSGVIPFTSPPSMVVEVSLPHRGLVSGMGIPRGITLITGGGFHGKSTLLKALERGVYNHIPEDGRELVVTDPTAVKIRAEDGRHIDSVDISNFIGDLPSGKSSSNFSTKDGSGSTSQAANIVESLEAGTRLLLLDEDTCATNFMIRDARMGLLVSGDHEPIKPFISLVKSLANASDCLGPMTGSSSKPCEGAGTGVSTILVVGGCGEYFDVADVVITMNSYAPFDNTAKAKEISAQFMTPMQEAMLKGYNEKVFPTWIPRNVECVLPRDDPKIKARRLDAIQIGDFDLDLSCVEQLVDVSQTRALAEVLRYVQSEVRRRGSVCVRELLDALEANMDTKGLDAIAIGGRLHGNLARPRRFEIVSALNRIRSSKFCQRR